MKIKLLANPKKAWAKELAKEVSTFLKSSNHTIVKKDAEITLCIGGDGTILYANHQNKLEGAILAIGSRKSYICQLNADNWKDLILVVIAKNKLIEVSTLSLVIMHTSDDSLDSENKTTSFNALNDFVVHSKDYRVLPIKISIYDRNKKPLNPPFGEPRSLSISKEFLGDGLIISSPLGSSAYAYSAGGSKLQLSEQKIELVPICPYKRTLGSFSIDDNQIIQIEVKKSCALIADGIFIKHIKDSILEIKKSKKMILFEGVGRND